MAQLVKRPTLAQVMISWFVSWSPKSWLEPASDSVSLSLPLPHLCFVSLSKISIKKRKSIVTELFICFYMKICMFVWIPCGWGLNHIYIFIFHISKVATLKHCILILRENAQITLFLKKKPKTWLFLIGTLRSSVRDPSYSWTPLFSAFCHS